MAAGSLLWQNQLPHNKIINAQGSAIQVGCVKHVDAYGSLKSCEIEHTSEFYDVLINCSSYSALKDNSMPSQLLCYMHTKQTNPENCEGLHKALSLLPMNEGPELEERFVRNLEKPLSSIATIQNHIQVFLLTDTFLPFLTSLQWQRSSASPDHEFYTYSFFPPR